MGNSCVYTCILFKCNLIGGWLIVSQLWWNWRYQLPLKSSGFSRKFQAVLGGKALWIFLAIRER